MCHSLFSHLYESRQLFIKALSDEFVAAIGNDSTIDLNPITVNHLFHQCVSTRQPFGEFGKVCAIEYTNQDALTH